VLSKEPRITFDKDSFCGDCRIISWTDNALVKEDLLGNTVISIFLLTILFIEPFGEPFEICVESGLVVLSIF
jgi:hypothetical protein